MLTSKNKRITNICFFLVSKRTILRKSTTCWIWSCGRPSRSRTGGKRRSSAKRKRCCWRSWLRSWTSATSWCRTCTARSRRKLDFCYYEFWIISFILYPRFLCLLHFFLFLQVSWFFLFNYLCYYCVLLYSIWFAFLYFLKKSLYCFF